MDYEFDIELTLKIITVILSLLLLLKGIREFTKAQRWKKLEFVSKEIKDFFNDNDIKRALILLDWNSNELQLNQGEIDNKTKFYFTDDTILNALKTHEEVKSFSDEEVIIKKVFDALFDKLIMFENYIETGLIKATDIEPYLKYWIKILVDKKNKRKNEIVRTQIWTYVNLYGYEKVRHLCDRKEFQ